jgi:hypothetical protein
MSREDFASLLGALLPFAQQKLAEHGQFLPFAGAVDQQGQVRGFAGKPEAEALPPKDIVELLVTNLRDAAQRGEFRAGAVCCDVRVAREPGGEKVDAVSIALEADDGTSMECYLPYTKSAAGEFEYGELFGSAVPPRIFLPAK